jgi:hypothetical protein
MTQETRYSYQKKIKELEREISRLVPYEILCKDIFVWVSDQVHQKEFISQGWLLKQFNRVFK